MYVRRSLIIVLVMVVIFSCGRSVDRAGAVDALVDAGASHAIATCIADTLALRDALSLTEPGRALTAGERSTLVAARDHCTKTGGDEVAVEVLSASVTSSEVESDRPAAADVAVPTTVSASSDPLGPRSSGKQMSQLELAIAASEAAARLIDWGRSPEFASCVVRDLIRLEATYVFESESFGMGASPIEANAYATCS